MHTHKSTQVFYWTGLNVFFKTLWTLGCFHFLLLHTCFSLACFINWFLQGRSKILKNAIIWYVRIICCTCTKTLFNELNKMSSTHLEISRVFAFVSSSLGHEQNRRKRNRSDKWIKGKVSVHFFNLKNGVCQLHWMCTLGQLWQFQSFQLLHDLIMELQFYYHRKRSCCKQDPRKIILNDKINIISFYLVWEES